MSLSSISIILLFALLFYFVNCKVKVKNDYESLGVVYLDAITFPKVVPHEKRAVLVLVFNKASVGDYLADQIRNEFYSFAKKGTIYKVMFMIYKIIIIYKKVNYKGMQKMYYLLKLWLMVPKMLN